MHHLERKLRFDQNQIWWQGSNQQTASIGLDNDLVQIKYQAIIGTHDGLI